MSTYFFPLFPPFSISPKEKERYENIDLQALKKKEANSY